MEAFLKVKSKQKVKKKSKKEEVFDIMKHNNYFKFNILDLAVIILSCISVISDICTDLILVIQYSYQGHKNWALATFILIFFPSLIVQFFSIKWHIYDKSINFVLSVFHGCMLGILYRYFVIIKFAIKTLKSNNSSDIEKIYLDQSDLCILHLFESFLESAPQLVLQIYVVITLNEWKFWTVLSAIISLLSLAWALVAYSKSQRQVRLNKKKCKWPGLALQAVWRSGMLTARITALVLASYCFGNYMFVLIFIHWICMTAWIIYQKTDFCDTFWEERIYNAVVGVIFIFCFFNILEGQSRWRLFSFYLIIVFQNLSCLKLFLTWFAQSNPKIAVFSFIAIIGGTVVGTLSIILYYKFFHPSGPIFFLGREKHLTEKQSSLTLTSLNRICCDSPQILSSKHSFQTESVKHLNTQSPLSDSVVIVEESSFENDTDKNIKILRDSIKEELDKSKNENFQLVVAKNCKIDNDTFKRRAICSSVNLEKMLESKTIEANLSKKPNNETNEELSEISLAHDYENLCDVNITRETCGLRSWKRYTDIETWFHDDSVIYDKQNDTLTSTTTSSDILPKDKKNLIQDYYTEELMKSETETIFDEILPQFSTNAFPNYHSGTLSPIFEVDETNNNIDLSNNIKIHEDSESTLVAIINEIRRNTPIQNRYPRRELIYSVSPLRSINLSRTQNWSKVRRVKIF